MPNNDLAIYIKTLIEKNSIDTLKSSVDTLVTTLQQKLDKLNIKVNINTSQFDSLTSSIKQVQNQAETLNTVMSKITNNVSKKTENLLWDMTEPDLDKRIANTEELKQRIYSNGVMVSKAYQTTDEVAIHYDDIKAIYNRVFWRRWDLERVLKKFDQIFSGVKSVVNDYGRELVTSPIGITLVHNGSKVQVHSPSDAYQVLPKSKDQKSGLVKVENHFSTSDGKVKVDLAYYEEPEARMGSYGGYYKEFCVVAKISVDSFTPSNRNEYNQLYKLLHGK